MHRGAGNLHWQRALPQHWHPGVGSADLLLVPGEVTVDIDEPAVLRDEAWLVADWETGDEEEAATP